MVDNARVPDTIAQLSRGSKWEILFGAERDELNVSCRVFGKYE